MYGFVYLLGNKAMPWHFKIGCTERSPHARAKALSNATGVPRPFDVLLYIEVANAERVERRFHAEMSDFRANRNREFFCFGKEHMHWLWHVFTCYDDVLSYAAPEWHRYASRPQFPDEYVETWIEDGSYLCPPDSPPPSGPILSLVAA